MADTTKKPFFICVSLKKQVNKEILFAAWEDSGACFIQMLINFDFTYSLNQIEIG
jgi:hypothetical protein